MTCCLPSHHLSLQHQSHTLTDGATLNRTQAYEKQSASAPSLPALTSPRPTQKSGSCGQLLVNATCSSGSLGHSNRTAQNYFLSAMEKMYLSQKLRLLQGTKIPTLPSSSNSVSLPPVPAQKPVK